MKKVLRLLLILLVWFSAFPSSHAQAAPPPPDHPWLSEIVDYDIKVVGGISTARLPGTNRLVVAYAGDRQFISGAILKFAMQVPKGSGNCGVPKDWHCMEVDTSQSVGYNPSIAVSPAGINPDGVYIGISYFDDANNSLKFASTFYDTRNEKLTSNWFIQTIDKPTGSVAHVGEISSLTYDPKTGMPMITYLSYGDHTATNPSKWLNSASYLGTTDRNCGYLLTWSCIKIVRAPYYSDTFSAIGLGWIDSKLYYFYASESGLSYATFAPSFTCLDPNYFCARVDTTDPAVGLGLKVSSWSGNLPGTPGYNSLMRENGVNIVFKDETDKRIKLLTTPKTGSLFSLKTVAAYGATAELSSLSVTTDPNYFAAVTYTEQSSRGDDLFLARPAPAYNMFFGGGCGITMGTWVCNAVLPATADSSAGGDAGIDVSPGNLVRIIFNSFNSNVNTYGLQILRQDDYKMSLPLIRR